MCYHISQTPKKIASDQVKERYGITSSLGSLFSDPKGFHFNAFNHPEIVVLANFMDLVDFQVGKIFVKIYIYSASKDERAKRLPFWCVRKADLLLWFVVANNAIRYVGLR